MAENNAQVMYSHPSRAWDRGYGTKVYKSIITTGANMSSPAVTTNKVHSVIEGCCHRGASPAASLSCHDH